MTSNQQAYERYKFYQNAAGSVPGAFDCWLVLRGVKTLAVRMRQHEANAGASRAIPERPSQSATGLLSRPT